MRLFLLRVLLKIMWSVGGKNDSVDGLPRLLPDDAVPMLQVLRAGDFLLLGNNGQLTHIAVYVGNGTLIHAMATERTMRGWFGSLFDAVKRMFGAPDRNIGVVEESIATLLGRYERDTWVAVRAPDLSDAACEAGLARVRSLVGRPYDYGFQAANEALYCTEVVDEFLKAALGDRAPTLIRTPVKVPLLLNAHGRIRTEPFHIWTHPDALFHSAVRQNRTSVIVGKQLDEVR